MRLWSLHPSYLDQKGLVALWREGLLAQAVLAGKTKGYRKHPQLNRFIATKDPLKTVGSYLTEVAIEASRRGYQFNKSKILKSSLKPQPIKVTRGQLRYEFEHLLKKLRIRNRGQFQTLTSRKRIRCHSLFIAVPGKIETWERV